MPSCKYLHSQNMTPVLTPELEHDPLPHYIFMHFWSTLSHLPDSQDHRLFEVGRDLRFIRWNSTSNRAPTTCPGPCLQGGDSSTSPGSTLRHQNFSPWFPSQILTWDAQNSGQLHNRLDMRKPRCTKCCTIRSCFFFSPPGPALDVVLANSNAQIGKLTGGKPF